MNRLWVQETNAKRVELEKDILALLKEELALMERKKDLYKEYNELMVKATAAYQDRDLSVWLKTLPPSPKI
tara:strand:+ start:228 stop:440 length:213 start_codon:yes stop_codon:yes gene_type:complete